MKRSITIATFISRGEGKNKDFADTIAFLRKDFEIESFVYCDKYILHNGIKQENLLVGTTKFKRITSLLVQAKNEIILCLDNDIVTDKKNLQIFMKTLFEKDFAIGWGIISCQPTKGLIPRLVQIDKELSHRIIRPFLWHIDWGISFPGQIFFINKTYFKDKITDYDTVFDDLTLGLISRQFSMPVYFDKQILGYEKPKTNLGELIRQRLRWAKGFSETLCYSRKIELQRYVWLHGFMYHVWGILFYSLLIYFIFKKIYILFGICFIGGVLLLSQRRLNHVWTACCYMLVFPVIHLIWLAALMFNFATRGKGCYHII